MYPFDESGMTKGSHNYHAPIADHATSRFPTTAISSPLDFLPLESERCTSPPVLPKFHRKSNLFSPLIRSRVTDDSDDDGNDQIVSIDDFTCFDGLTNSPSLTFDSTDVAIRQSKTETEVSFQSSLQSSIDAIREEAARVDAMIAMDQLDTLKHELDQLQKEVAKKSAQLEEQRTMLQRKEDERATLELERDLYKADANKLMNDVLKLRLEAEERKFDNDSGDEDFDEPDQANDHEKTTFRFFSTRRPGDLMENESTLPVAPQTPTSFVLLYPGARASTDNSESTSSKLTSSQEVSSNFLHPNDHVKRDGDDGDEDVLTEPLLPKRKLCLSRILCTRERSAKGSNLMDPVSNTSGMSGWDLNAEVDGLQRRLTASAETSNELRRRIAMVTRCYENAIYQLESQLKATNMDRKEMKKELNDQIVSITIEKRQLLRTLEARLLESSNIPRIKQSNSKGRIW